VGDTLSEYLEFVDVPNHSGKTRKVNVVSKRHGYSLGLIQWYGRWRQYVFVPGPETVFNRDCLRDIAQYLQEMMDERKKVAMFNRIGDTKITLIGDIQFEPSGELRG